MFLHLGGNVVVPLNNIIAIIDVDSISKSKDSKDFFKLAEKKGFVYKISSKETKSYVITERVEKKNKGALKIIRTIIYFSPISSVTLHKRTGFIDELSEI